MSTSDANVSHEVILDSMKSVDQRERLRMNQQRFRERQRLRLVRMQEGNAQLSSEVASLSQLNVSLKRISESHGTVRRNHRQKVLTDYTKLLLPAVDKVQGENQVAFFRHYFSSLFTFCSEYYMSIPDVISRIGCNEDKVCPQSQHILLKCQPVDMEGNIFKLYLRSTLSFTRENLAALIPTLNEVEFENVRSLLEGKTIEHLTVQTAFFEQDDLIQHIHNEHVLIPALCRVIKDTNKIVQLLNAIRMKNIIGSDLIRVENNYPHAINGVIPISWS